MRGITIGLIVNGGEAPFLFQNTPDLTLELHNELKMSQHIQINESTSTNFGNIVSLSSVLNPFDNKWQRIKYLLHDDFIFWNILDYVLIIAFLKQIIPKNSLIRQWKWGLMSHTDIFVLTSHRTIHIYIMIVSGQEYIPLKGIWNAIRN